MIARRRTREAEVERTRMVDIEPQRGWVPLRPDDLWEYRELLYFLAWRDIKIRYKQTVLGAAWAIIQPFLMMVVFSIFFGRLGGIPSDGLPYPVFVYCALLPWQLFAQALTQSGNSLVGSQTLITKVYFPRLIIPLSAVLGGVMDFAIAFLVLVGMMIYYGIVPTIAVLAIPLFVLLALGAALGAGLWLSALNVQYRDVRYTLPFLTQVWFFVTPVVYPASLVPERWRWLYGLNPMTGVVEGFRWALLGAAGTPGTEVAVSVVVVAVFITGGAYYFRYTERTFADVV
jgi:lipopolysaccharide transport system permease protein